jgi:ferrochelatase
MSGGARVGVLLLTFGSAVTSADVPAYLRSVRGGREASAELVAEFARRFDVIGRSPLIDITLEQAAGLQRRLNGSDGDHTYVVSAGMLHSQPWIADALRGLVRDGATRVVAVVMAPQYSPLILTGYERTLAAAVAELAPGLPVRLAGAWHTTASWVASLSNRVEEALQGFDDAERDRVAIVFTAHSLPRPVVERDPGYLLQVEETIAAVTDRLGLADDRWVFAFQSAGHTPEEWLKPDLADVLPGIRESGAREVLVVPVQFVTDHLEILYDIDVAAADQARSAQLRFHRIAMPNTDPQFIDALAEVVHREMAAVHA